MLFSLLASIGYCLMAWQLNHRSASHQQPAKKRIFVLMALALLAHLLLLFQLFSPQLDNVSVTNIITLMAFCMVVISVLRFYSLHDRAALAIVLFMAALCVWLPIVSPAPATITRDGGVKIHVVLSIAAYISLGFSALYALFLLLQDYQLRRGSKGFNLAISLNDIERTMIRFAKAGEVLLTLSLATGVVFIHNIWAQHVAHKLFFGALSWVLIGILLFRHQLRGFRGPPAACWLVAGFSALVIAYLGTAFVLQFLLS